MQKAVLFFQDFHRKFTALMIPLPETRFTMRRTKEDALQTRCQLLQAAKALFNEKGFSRTTLAEIAQKAGLTRGAAYWHFKSKDEIFITIVEQALDDMTASKKQALSSPDCSAKERLQRLLALPCTLPTEYALVNSVATLLPAYPQFAELEASVQRHKDQLRKLVQDFLEDAQQQGLLTLHASTESTTKLLFLLFEGLYFHTQEGKVVTGEELSDFLEILCQFH